MNKKRLIPLSIFAVGILIMIIPLLSAPPGNPPGEQKPSAQAPSLTPSAQAPIIPTAGPTETPGVGMPSPTPGISPPPPGRKMSTIAPDIKPAP